MKAIIKSAIIVASLIIGGCNNFKSTDMENEKNDAAANYACPMHPEVTGEKGDKCPKCGMDLTATTAQADDFHAELTARPTKIGAGNPVELTFVYSHNGRPLKMEMLHEKKLHLMAVSDDLSWFRHIHPEEQQDGSFVVTQIFPHGGKYLLFSDFKPTGGKQSIDRQEIIVEGEAVRNEPGKSLNSVSEVDGYKVTLENANDLKTNRTQPLRVSLEKNGKKLTEKDIEKYLGANAHIVMISKAGKEYLHLHPVSNEKYPIYAETHIDKPGQYRVWVEFKVDGKVRTADFTVNVGNAQPGEESAGHPHHH